MSLFRKSRPEEPTVYNDPAAAQHALADRMFDRVPGTSALLTECDSVLAERLLPALAAGMAQPDLADVPAHRRPQAIEDALANWDELAAGGPCGWCGCSLRRRGRTQVVSAMSPLGPAPAFIARHGQRSCGACAEVLADGGPEELGRQVFACMVGLRGWGIARHKVRFFHEANLAPALREPWAYLETDALRRFAFANYIHEEFATSPLEARPALPGLPQVVHAPADLPPKVKRSMPGATIHPYELAAARKRRDEQARKEQQKRDQEKLARVQRMVRS